MAVVEELFIYPLKSGRAIPVPRARLRASGLEWDRHWMAVNPSGRFLSQRTHPLLARIVPRFTSDSLILEAPDLPSLKLPLGTGSQLDTGPESAVTVEVWDDSCAGFDQGDSAARWVSQAIGDSARLVRVADQSNRLANPKYAGPYPVPMAFSDGYPILVCNRASLDGLNRRMPEAVPMERFRPNIVLGGLPEFAEDRIDTLHLGGISLRLVKPCTRCVITSTDQRTGERSTDPLPVLRTFRFNRELLGVAFGENAIVASGAGTVLERGAACEAVFTEPADSAS